MHVYYVTTNKGKVASMERELRAYSINVKQAPLDIPEPRADSIEEISRTKAELAYEKLKQPLIVNDTGFFIPSLGGFPGPYVKYMLKTIKLEGLLRLVEEDRRCHFLTSYCFYDGKEPHFVNTPTHGTLSHEQRGTLQPHHWSELLRLFIPDGLNRTLAELDEEEYKAWVGRNQSGTRNFVQWYMNHV